MKAKLSTGVALTLAISTTEIRKADGSFKPMKDWVAANHPGYDGLDAKAKKPIRDAYNLLKAKGLQENKAVASAIVSHEGLRVNRVAIRTSKAGKVSASITMGEKPKDKSVNKLAAAEAKIAELEAANAAKDAALAKAGVALSTPATVEVPTEQLA